MHIKIYFENKPLFLCDEIDDELQPYVRHDDAVFIDELNTHTIKTILHEMNQPQVHAGVFLHKNFEELKQSFFKKFHLVKAAGGLVVNESSEILFIFRRGKWDMPKGKLDIKESMEFCAEREVKEETGLYSVTLVSPLLVTYHTYSEGTRHILKETHWFYMTAKNNQLLQPQTEEEITDIKWVNSTELEKYLSNAYHLITDIIEAAKKRNIIAAEE